MSQVKIEEQIGGIILRMKGQFIGSDETEDLKNSFNQLIEKNNMKLVIDMDKVTYLNSTALGILISVHSNYLKRNAKIVLCNIGKSIENIFMITKLSMVFEIEESIENAIKKISE